jgi:hypothetical protein
MGAEIKIDPAALAEPAKRFEAGAASLTQIGQAVKAAMRKAGEAARHPAVVQATGTFGDATGAVLNSFAGDCGKMAEKLRGAGLRYHVTDETALVVQLVGVDLEVPAAPR